MEGEQLEVTLPAEGLNAPVVLLCGDFDVLQHGANINRFAVVAAMISAQPLHEWPLNCHSFRRAASFAAATPAGFLVAEPVFVPAGIQAEVFEHLLILFHRLVEGGQIIAHHQGAGASQENHALRIAQIHRPSAGNHDFLPRQNEPETGDGL